MIYSLLFVFVAAVNAAPIPPTSTSASYSHHLKSSSQRARSPDTDRDDELRDVGDPISTVTPHSSNAWAILVAKLLAGVAILCAIFVLIFFLHRRRVRGRRRRIGEMMGLGIKRNEILDVERTHARKGKEKRKFSDKDHAAHRWRKEDRGSGGTGMRDEQAVIGRREEDEERDGGRGNMSDV
jgi:ATP-dependent Zn protease